MIYRVELKVSYMKVCFDFDNSEEAVTFAEGCVSNNVKCEGMEELDEVTVKIMTKKESEVEE